MKNIFRNIALASILATGIAMTSCEDMMTVDTGDKTYVNAQDTLYSYLGVMRAMQDVAERQVILGEIRGDLVSSTDYTTDTLYAISNFDNPKDQSCTMLQVSDYYNVINNCNFYIKNADTAAVKSNVKYMIPEYAQVKAIRAWAYLQLVKNYKEVPYITEPVSSLDVIKNFDYTTNLVDKDNLIDRIIEDGILNYLDTRYPSYGSGSTAYGSWNYGAGSVKANLLFIPIRVVLGDMYLLRGANQSDFEKAAQYYFDYLKKETYPMYLQYCTLRSLGNGMQKFYGSANGWGTWAKDFSDREVTSLIASSSNAGLGKTLTRVADIFGYTPTSSQSNDETVDEDGETTGEFEASGSISVERNYKRQYAPSEAYNDVVTDQTYVNYTTASTGNLVSYIKNEDARYGYSVEEFNKTIDGVGASYPLCCKAAKEKEFFYSIVIYRKSLIWLRLAEAINRAGYPEYAFAILKDGLNKSTLPKIVDRYENLIVDNMLVLLKKSNQDTLYYDATNEKYYHKVEGEYVEETGTVKGYNPIQVTIPNDSIAYGTYKQMYYITDKTTIEKFGKFLDFTDDVWNSTYGIHAKGCGKGSWNATNTELNKDEIPTNICGYNDSVYYDYSKLLAKQGVDLKTADKNALINAVENIIVDELALETAFEGNRFTDLVRIAEHKNNNGVNGTEWLAKKIANRGTRKNVEEAGIVGVDGYNAEIYSKLQNTNNWYFTLPAWK